MAKDFSQIMSERTDKQLVDIITLKRDEYQPEAIIAAEKEIERRQIHVGTVYTELIHAVQHPSQPDKANVEFEWYHKELTVLLPAGSIVLVSSVFNYLGPSLVLRVLGLPVMILMHYAIHRALKDSGYAKMAKDFLKWITYALYIYIGILVIAGIIIGGVLLWRSSTR